MRWFSATLMAIGCLLGAPQSQAAEIAPACALQAPWGAPTWSGPEPALTPLCRKAYVVLHDDSRLVPAFVSWQLTAKHALGCLPRHDAFAPDPELAPGHRAELSDYRNHPGFDRGHFAPNSDFEWDALVERQSFYLSNMSPQASHLNQWEWEELEAATRTWTLSRPALVVMSGPIWAGKPRRIGPHHVAVPAGYWKVIVDPAANDALAFTMKNEPTPKGDLTSYLVAIATVEQRAGMTLPLPAAIDRSKVGPLWVVDLSAFTRAKAAACD